MDAKILVTLWKGEALKVGESWVLTGVLIFREVFSLFEIANVFPNKNKVLPNNQCEKEASIRG